MRYVSLVPADPPSPDRVTIPARDGAAIVARTYAPTDRVRAKVLVASAMGVPQGYYGPLARWLAARGFAVTTFDYRGVGESRRGSLRGLDIDIVRWAELDAGAVLAHLLAHADGRPIVWLGHSLGGQVLPFVPGIERVAHVVTVASGSGYWRENSLALRWRAPLLWYLIVPIALRTMGYFPGARLGMVGDLPAGVMAQWRRWCLHPEYAAGAEGDTVRARYAAVRTPITALCFTDDEYMSARNVEALHGCYVGAPRRILRLTPADAGGAPIGHFGFFKARHADALWTRQLLPVLEQASA